MRSAETSTHRCRDGRDPRLVVGGAAAGVGHLPALLAAGTIAAAIMSRHCRRVVLIAAVMDGVVDWLAAATPRRRRCRADRAARPTCCSSVVDDLAYGLGLWWGVVRERNLRALKPQITTDLDRRRLAQRCADRRCWQCWIGCGRTAFRRSALHGDRPRGGARARRPGELLAQTADGLQLPIGVGSPLVRRYLTSPDRPPAAAAALIRGARWSAGPARSTAVTSAAGCHATSIAWPSRAGHGPTSCTLPRHRDRPGLRWAAARRGGPILVRRFARIDGGHSIFRSRRRACRIRLDRRPQRRRARAPFPPGVGAVPLNIDRRYPASALAARSLIPALNRPNLTLLRGHRVARFGSAGSRAIGVDCHRSSRLIDLDRRPNRVVGRRNWIGPAVDASGHRPARIDAAESRGCRWWRRSSGGTCDQRSPGMGAADRLDGGARPAAAGGGAEHDRRSRDQAVHGGSWR